MAQTSRRMAGNRMQGYLFPVIVVILFVLLAAPSAVAAGAAGGTYQECSAYDLLHAAPGGGTTGTRFAYERHSLLSKSAARSDIECQALCDANPACRGVAVVGVADAWVDAVACHLVGNVADVVGTSLAARSYGRRPPTPADPSALTWCLARPTTHVFQEDSCRSVSLCATLNATRLELRGAPGSSAAGQLVLRVGAQGAAERVTVKFSELTTSTGVTLPSSALQWRQVAYVLANKTEEYVPERPYPQQWYPDPLVSVDSVPLRANVTLPLWLSVELPHDVPAGNYSGTATVVERSGAAARTLLQLQLAVEVWRLDLRASLRDFADAWGFDPAPLKVLYGTGSPLSAATAAFHRELCAHRTPPSSLASQWAVERPIGDIEYLLSNSSDGCNERLFNAAYLSSSTNASAAYVNATLDSVAPRMAQLSEAGLLSSSYVYAFDESHEDHKDALVALFGGVRQRWPAVRTLSVLPWPPSLELPLDIWVVQYEFLQFGFGNHSAAEFQSALAAFQQSGREVWGYHCISPRGRSPDGAQYLNTFLDVPPIEARLLRGWLPLHAGVSGWLYWYSNWGMGHAKGQPAVVAVDSEGHTQYDPTIYTGGSTTSFSNEDGNVVYAGPTGPVSSQRLECLRAGAQDAALLSMLPRATAGELTAKVLRDSTHRTDSGKLVDEVIREAARLVAAA